MERMKPQVNTTVATTSASSPSPSPKSNEEFTLLLDNSKLCKTKRQFVIANANNCKCGSKQSKTNRIDRTCESLMTTTTTAPPPPPTITTEISSTLLHSNVDSFTKVNNKSEESETSNKGELYLPPLVSAHIRCKNILERVKPRHVHTTANSTLTESAETPITISQSSSLTEECASSLTPTRNINKPVLLSATAKATPSPSSSLSTSGVSSKVYSHSPLLTRLPSKKQNKLNNNLKNSERKCKVQEHTETFTGSRQNNLNVSSEHNQNEYSSHNINSIMTLSERVSETNPLQSLTRVTSNQSHIRESNPLQEIKIEQNNCNLQPMYQLWPSKLKATSHNELQNANNCSNEANVNVIINPLNIITTSKAENNKDKRSVYSSSANINDSCHKTYNDKEINKATSNEVHHVCHINAPTNDITKSQKENDKQYLLENGVPELFNDLTKDIFRDKPVNTLQFIRQWLDEKRNELSVNNSSM